MVLLVTAGVLLVVVMGLVGVVVGVNIVSDREKLSAFECGFDGSGEGRFYFSLRFFLVTVMFLMFDVEMVLLLPLPLVLEGGGWLGGLLGGVVFLLVLLGGLYYEWAEGALEWNWESGW